MARFARLALGGVLTIALWSSGQTLLSGPHGAGLEAASSSASARAQPEAPEGSQSAPAGEHAASGGEEQHSDFWPVLAKTVNFALLAGALVYFLRAPLSQYLAGRTAQVRQELVTAAEMRAAAARQIEEIDRRREALPAELDALRTRGAEEIAAEETRIRQAADTERGRLLEQTRREIDLQVKIAMSQLIDHAADLAVRAATERIRRSMTDEDHRRLVDRYVEQVNAGDRSGTP